MESEYDKKKEDHELQYLVAGDVGNVMPTKDATIDPEQTKEQSHDDIPLDRKVSVNEFTGDVTDYERGSQMFLEGGLRKIDYILVWSSKNNNSDKRNKEKENARNIFERNLRKEGLVLEEDIQKGRPHQFMKIHAPWEVLTRYAECMKIRMPIKEKPEDLPNLGFWEMMTNQLEILPHPFKLNSSKVPDFPKKYTHVFERDKMYLFNIPEDRDRFISNATRSRIVDYILRRKEYTEDGDSYSLGQVESGVRRLVADGTYLAAFPLHEGGWKRKCKMNMRKLLYGNWASWKVWYKVQPLHYIRVYFGEKTGLYFSWLGYYTYALVPASLIGLIVFIYGVATINSDPISLESCDPNNMYIMCPMCNKRCGYWEYHQKCLYVQVTHMFDNGATVLFAIFMSLWGTLYLEFWKREQAGIQFLWDLRNFEEEEEPPRPEYMARLSNCQHKKKHKISGVEEPYYPYWSRQLPVHLASIAVIFFLALIAMAAIIGIIFYRMSLLAALYMIDEPIVYKNATIVVSVTAAFINLFIIFGLNFICAKVATRLTDWECLRTQSEYDNNLTFKLYLLQFVNYYSSLFYIAFFKGKFAGTPAHYKTFFGARQEECQGGSCLTELCIHLAIVFVGKQLIQNNLVEIFLPRFMRWKNRLCTKTEEGEKLKLSLPWEKDFNLEEMGPIGLFREYLEMMIQFGFVTLFVAAFPLAPFFALLNNIIELRSDADKFVTQFRRRMAARAQDIGIWYDILHGLTRFAILTNGLIIAFTSSFIQREVYKAAYNPKKNLEGFVNNSLAYFNISDFPHDSRPDPGEIKDQYNTTQLCRYPNYRLPPWSDNKYQYTTQYWHVVAAQFIFLVIFENTIILMTSLVAYIIPDIPKELREQMRRETVITNGIVLETELERERGRKEDQNELQNIRQRTVANDERSNRRRSNNDVIRMKDSNDEMTEVHV